MPVAGAVPSNSTVTEVADGTLHPMVACPSIPFARQRNESGAPNSTTSGPPSAVVSSGGGAADDVVLGGMESPGPPGTLAAAPWPLVAETAAGEPPAVEDGSTLAVPVEFVHPASITATSTPDAIRAERQRVAARCPSEGPCDIRGRRLFRIGRSLRTNRSYS